MPRLNTPEDKRVGRRIRAARKSAGITQATLGEALGVAFQQIQKYENGTNRVTVGRLQPLARALGVTVSYLTEGSDEQPTEFDEFLALPGSREVMAAFVAIEDADTRKALIRVMQAAAGLGAERVSAVRKRRSSP